MNDPISVVRTMDEKAKVKPRDVTSLAAAVVEMCKVNAIKDISHTHTK